MNYAQKLKEYRLANGLKKADMARAFKVDWQTYHNWEKRLSLPKEFYEDAERLLAGFGTGDSLIIARQKLERLSPAGLEAALQSINAILDLEKKS